MCVCLECGAEYAMEKSLHAHLKAHKLSTADYYTKHWNRVSEATGEPIEFVNAQQYKSAFFNSRSEMRRFFKKIAKKGSEFERKRALDIGRSMIEQRIKEKELSFIPSEFELSTVNAPTLSVLSDIKGDFYESMEHNFLLRLDPPSAKRKVNGYFVDTREQQPWELPNSIVTKLEIGDYAASGKAFSNVFVDRKNPSDFLGTFGANGIERFERELSRAVSHDAFLFVVVESDLSQLYKEVQVFGSKQTLDSVLAGCRRMLKSYPKHIQFVLAGTRDRARKVAIDALSIEDAPRYDFQYLINKNLI